MLKRTDRRPLLAHVWTKDPHGFYIEPEWCRVDNVITNPPYHICRAFAEHALKLARRKVAMIWLARRLNAARWLVNTPLCTRLSDEPAAEHAARARHPRRRRARRRHAGFCVVGFFPRPSRVSGVEMAAQR